MAKKGFFKTLRSFSFAAALFAGTLGVALFGAVFASCENLNGDMSSPAYAPSSGGANGGQSAGGSSGASVDNCLTASVSLPGLPSLAGIAPVPKNVAQNISKSAFPNIADTAATAYSFSATLTQAGAGGATYSADGTYDSVTGICSFVFAGAKSAAAANYTLTVSLYHTGGTPAVKSLVASGSQDVSVGADAPSFSASVSLAPNLESGAPNGSLSLPINFSDTSVTSVQLTLLDSGNHDVTASYLDCGTSLTLTGGSGTIESVAGGLPAGTYTLLMSFMKGTAQVGARTESLNVYPAMETKLWWTKDGIGAAATALSVTQFNQKEFYVRGTGGVFYTTVFPTAAEAEDTNNGSFAFPLKTIQEAVNRITASGDTTSLFTVYIDGKIEGDPGADYTSNQSSLVRLGSSSVPFENKILFKGWTGPDTDIVDVKKSKDSVKPGRAFFIIANSSAKVAIKDLGITHGANAGNGGGFYINSCADMSLENCKISECYAASNYDGGGFYISKSTVVLKKCVVTQSEARSGGGVYIQGSGSTAKGCLTIENSEISANTASGGGGVYVSVYSTLNFLSGQISGNKATYSSSVTNSGLGGGVYINSSGNCFISGSAVVGQALSSTSSCATSAEGSHSNSAQYGGGIYNRGELYLGYTDDSTPAAWTGAVCYNYASSDGGGIFSYGSSSLVKMNAGSVAYNLCSDGSGTTGGGGGVAVQYSSVFTMSGGTVSYNQTNNKVGGGIYVDSGATLTLSGTAEVSSNKTSPDGTGSMGGAGLFAYRASIAMEGNAVVKDNLCKACGGGVYLYEYESASSCASLAMSGNAKILENTSSDGLGGAVYVAQRCSFSMQGAATIPAGVGGTTGAGKNDVYLDVNTSVAVPAAITSTATPVATITPKSPYAVDTPVLTGTALTAAECAKFELTQPAGVEFPWTIEYDSTNGGVLKHDRNVFYVADYGNNTSGDGTKDNPYETIKFALTKFTDKMPASVDFKNKIYVLTDMTYGAGLGSDVPCYYEIVGCKGGTVGNNVTFTFDTPGDSGLYVAYGQKIKLTHIDITQSSAAANNYAAILVENSSTNGVGELWMEDCSIKNMYANACSAIAAKGDVHLKNVEISGNKTVANTSGATPFGPAINSTTGTVSVLGKLVIKDNQMQINTAAAGDPPSYVYKDQNLWIGENSGTAVFHPIRIAGVLDGESDIGVTLFDYGTLYTTFTSGFASAGISAPSDVFASDDGMSVVKSSNEAIMMAPTSLYVSQTGSDLIGNGSRLAPFATINKAISTINAFDASGISYMIYVGGTVKGYAEIPDGVKAAKITIDKDPLSLVTNTLDGVGKASPVLTINAAIPVDISNLTITRGSRGIDIEESATVKITDCVVTGNGGSVTGAGIYVRKGSVDISGTEISGNTTSSNGGGLYVASSGVTGFTMTGGAITGNSAAAGGGADINCQKGANPLMDGVTISGNTASAGNGGGIFVTSGMYLGIKDCVISGNTAGTASVSGHGGGIYNAGTCYIYGSTVIGDAGAGEAAKLDDGKHSNLATGYGGGIYNAKNLYLGYSDYTSVTSYALEPLTGGVYYNFAGRGGAIYAASSTQTVVASGTYKYNSVSSSSGGGAIFNAGTLTMHDGLIDGNVACLGGGVYVSSSGSFTMNDGTISDNYANESDACGGGGVLVAGAFAMNSGAISGNHGYLGGGVYISSDSSMSGGTISGNDAVSGGGVYIAENKFTMTGGVIEENTATANGGGVDVHNDTTSVGTLELGDNAYIPLGTTNNDVYLGNAISLVSSLDKAAPVVTITPSVYGTTEPVLTEATPGLVGGNYGKFAVTPQTISGGVTKNWTVNSAGYLAQVGSSGGSITIHTPEGDLNLAASATTITTSATDTTVTISATDASGSAITSGLAWNGVTVYYGTDEIATGTGNSYKFLKAFPKGTYRLTVSVTYNGTTYSDTFTIKKTVDGYVAQPNVFDGEATLCADDADRKSSVFIEDRPITISATLWACDHETTQGEYETYCFYGGGSSNEPSDTYGKGTNYPAYYVSWYDAIVYCNLRSIAEGKTACYKLGSESNPKNWSGIVAGTGANAGKYCGPSSDNSVWNGITCDFEASGYRLPTQAEWEYLARGKNLTNDGQTIYSGSDIADDVVWHSGNASGKSHEVGGLAANDAGLYDMCGNVWEWCWDWTGAINASTPATGNSSGVYRRYLGGSWNFAASTAKICSSSSSYSYTRNYFTGFRVVRTAP